MALPTAVSNFRNAEERKEERVNAMAARRLGSMTSLYAELRVKLAAQRRELDSAEAKLELLVNDHRQAEAKLREIQAADAVVLGMSLAAKLAQIAAVKAELASLLSLVASQTATVKASSHALNVLEHDVVEAEVEVGRLRDHAAESSTAQSAAISSEIELAATRVNISAAQAANAHRAQTEERAVAAALQATAATVKSSKLAESRSIVTAFGPRAADVSARATAAAAAFESLIAAETSHRAQAVVQLKRDMDGVQATLSAQNAERALVRAAHMSAQVATSGALLAAGKNPYEVARATEQRAVTERVIATHAARTTEAEVSITATVFDEEKRASAAEHLTSHDTAAVQRYNSIMSRSARQGATGAYIRSRTIGATDLLDPSGRSLLPVQPSTVTQLKPAAFGTGRLQSARPDIVASLAAKHADVGTISIGVKKSTRLTSRVGDVGVGLSDDVEGVAALDGYEDGYGSGAAAMLPGGGGDSDGTTGTGKGRARGKADMSVYETKMFGRALERQRENIFQAQVVGGRELVGPGFACDPPVIHFKDFVVGEAQTLVIHITNISLSFNAFRLDALPDAICDYFTISYRHPGRMSAGMCVPVTITFEPKRNQDIDTLLVIAAQTGRISIPLRCSTRKCLPRLVSLTDNLSVAIGRVTLGEDGTAVMTLINDGAIATVAHVAVRASDSDVHSDSQGNDIPSLFFPPTFTLPPYQSVRIPFKYRPARLGGMQWDATVSFEEGSCEPLQFRVSAEGCATPLYLQAEAIDFETCLLDKVYRCTVVVRNRSPIAMKCSFHVPTQYIAVGCFECLPSTGFVQGRDVHTGADGAFAFTLKFTPNACLLSLLASESLPQAGSLSFPGRTHLDVQLTLTSPDQVLPCHVQVRADVTRGELVITPPTLNFGACTVGQSVTRTVTVFNPSTLPVQALVNQLPSGFSLHPDSHGPRLTILPGESVLVPLCMAPSAQIRYSGEVCLQTTTGAKQGVVVEGEGTSSHLQLSHASVLLAAAGSGEYQTAAVVLTNTRTVDVEYRCTGPFSLTNSQGVTDAASGAYARASSGASVEQGLNKGLGEGSPLSVFPTGGKLLAGASVRLMITYAPLATATSTAAPSRWVLPVVSHMIRDTSGGAAPGDTRLVQSTCSLAIFTSLAEPTISLSSHMLQLGQVAVGGVGFASVTVGNDSDVPLDISCHIPDQGAIFRIEACPHTLAPHTYDIIKLAFTPGSQKIYSQVVLVRTGSSAASTSISVQGEGVNPNIRFEPPESATIDFGSVVLGDKVSRSVHMRNVSIFPISVAVAPQAMPSDAALGVLPLPTFTIDPPITHLLPDQVGTLTLTYAPSFVPRGGEHLRATFGIDISGRVDPAVCIQTAGRCFDRAAYLLPNNPSCHPTDQALMAYAASPLCFDHGSLGSQGSSTSGGAADAASDAADTFVVNFPLVSQQHGPAAGLPAEDKTTTGSALASGRGSKQLSSTSAHPDASVATETFTIWCIDRDNYSVDKPATISGAVTGGAIISGTVGKGKATVSGGASGAGKAGSGTVASTSATFTVTFMGGSDRHALPHYFTVEPATGSVVPGSAQVLTFKHSPPQPPPRSSSGSGQGSSIVTAGYWSNLIAKVVLTNGFVYGGGPAQKTYTLHLKGYVPFVMPASL